MFNFLGDARFANSLMRRWRQGYGLLLVMLLILSPFWKCGGRGKGLEHGGAVYAFLPRMYFFGRKVKLFFFQKTDNHTIT